MGARSVRMLIDSDAGAASAARRTFTVREGISYKITAVGLVLAEKLPVYVLSGSPTETTTPANTNTDSIDYLWGPLVREGQPVELSITNTQLIESVPGTYMVGAPSPAPVLSGNVNVAAEELGEDYLSLPGKPSGSAANPLPVSLGNDCTTPVFVELCEAPTFMVETALAQLGSVYNGANVLTGRVMVLRTTDEDTGVITTKLVLYNTDGTVVDPYTGPWSDAPVIPPGAPATKQLRADGQNIAAGIYIPDFAGSTTTWSPPNVGISVLQSVSVTVYDILDPANNDRVIVQFTSGNIINLVAGQTLSWSVAQDLANEFLNDDITITALGNASGVVTWTENF